MNIEECNKAAAERVPVIANGIRYGRISAVIKYFSSVSEIRRGAESSSYMVQLEDKNGHSVTVVSPEIVKRA